MREQLGMDESQGSGPHKNRNATTFQLAAQGQRPSTGQLAAPDCTGYIATRAR